MVGGDGRATPAEALVDAQWIEPPGPIPSPGQRPAYEFRRVFDLQRPPATAVLTATAHGIYEAIVNGRRVGDIELAPGATSYRHTLYVQQYDVSALLQAGSNELRLVVSDGWFRGKCGPDRIADNFGSQIAVVGALMLTDAAATTRLVTDLRWQVGVGSVMTADLMDGQHTDLRRIGAETWERAIPARDPLTRDESRLEWSAAPPVRVKEQFSPVAVSRLRSGRQIVDFGQNLSGRVRLKRLGAVGARVELTHGEVLDAQGDLSLENLAYAPPWKPPVGVGQKDIVVSRGVDGDTFEPRHTTHGFRYVAVDGLDADLRAEDITAVQLRSDLTPTGRFRCSDRSLTRLYELTVASWHANTCDIPTDCPQRERWGYTGDFQIFARSAAFLDDVEEFSRKWLRSLADDQDESGLIRNVAPLCGVSDDPAIPISLDGAAGWGDAATIVPWELYRQYGDTALIAEFFPMMAGWVDYAAQVAASGRHPERAARHPSPRPHEAYIWDTGWQWGEWLEPDGTFDWQADQGIVATAYLALSAGIVARSAEVLGRDADETRYRELERNAIAAWQAEFLLGDGTVSRPTQANCARALAFGLVPAEHRLGVAAQLAGLIAQNGDRLSTGFLSTGLLLPALADHGHADLAFTLLFQRQEPSWMTMVDRGATTIWEAWDGIDEHGQAHSSLNHYSKGAVIAFLHEYVAGIRPMQPGYAAVEIAPHPHPSLTHASAELDTRNGPVTVSWKTDDGRFELQVKTAAGVPTLVQLPDGTQRKTDGGEHRFECRLLA